MTVYDMVMNVLDTKWRTFDKTMNGESIVIRKRNSLETPRNRAVILVDTIVPIFEAEFTTNGPPNLHTFKKQHGDKGRLSVWGKPGSICWHDREW